MLHWHCKVLTTVIEPIHKCSCSRKWTSPSVILYLRYKVSNSLNRRVQLFGDNVLLECLESSLLTLSKVAKRTIFHWRRHSCKTVSAFDKVDLGEMMSHNNEKKARGSLSFRLDSFCFNPAQIQVLPQNCYFTRFCAQYFWQKSCNKEQRIERYKTTWSSKWAEWLNLFHLYSWLSVFKYSVHLPSN